MLRAIWRAIVVLPVPWAPPMSSNSPARRPVPIVLSSGVNPSGTGWYSRQLAGRDPLVQVDQDVECRPRRHAAVVGVKAPGARRGGRGVRFAIGAHAVRFLPGGVRLVPVVQTTERSTATARNHPPGLHAAPHSGRQSRGDLVERRDDRPDRTPRNWRDRDHSLGACALSCGLREPEQHDRQAEDRLEAGRDRDRAALADVDGRLAERRLEGPRGGLRHRDGPIGVTARPATAEVRDGDGHAGRRRPRPRSRRSARRCRPDPGRRPGGSSPWHGRGPG